jgi:hypothetical protein
MLTERPEIGRFYQVPCIQAYSDVWTAGKRGHVWVPVVGPPHIDAELDFDAQHYHPDWRFVPLRLIWILWGRDLRWERAKYRRKDLDSELALFKNVISAWKGEPELHRRKCLRLTEWPFHSGFHEKVEHACAGLRLKPGTLICPHRGVPLHGCPVDADGCVICPGHGAKWRLETGELVSRLTEADPCPA